MPSDYLDANKMTRTQFAKQLGVSKGYISQVLNGEFNHRLSKFIELALAIGKAPMVELEDLQEVVEKESKGMTRRKATYVPRAPFSFHITHKDTEIQSLKKPEKKQKLANVCTKQNEGKWESPGEMIYFKAEDFPEITA